MKFRERMWRFRQGRNGMDQLNQCLMWFTLGLALLNMFLGSHLIYLTEVGLLAWVTYRAMSRQIFKRQQECRAFVGFFGRIKKLFRLQKNKWKDRKTHVYKKCPKCKNTLRLPRIKGSHTVCCPCCNNRFGVDV